MGEAMSNIQQIVFGDDGSAAADVGWLWLNNHRWPGWRVTVVRAELPEWTQGPLDEDLTKLHPWEPPQSREAFEEAGFASVHHLTAVADPRIVLGSCRDAALIVVGPRGPGLLKAVHLGSTTEWLLLRPPAPLAIVKSARPTQRVLAGMDGSAHAWRALRTLIAFPWLSETQVTVLGVLDGRAEVPDACDAAAAELTGVAAAVDVRIVGTPVTASIHDVLDREDIDLVALGTRGHTGLKHLVLGSTASHVVRAARCSVLVATEHPAGD